MRTRRFVRRWLPAMLALTLFATGCSSGDDDPGPVDDGATDDGAADDGAADDETGDDGGGDAVALDRLVVGTDAEPTTLDIQAIDDNGLKLATWSINEALVDIDPEGDLEPVLAASLPQIDEDDRTRWTVELREGIEFSDGTPFNAEAVVANVDRVLDPEYESTLRAELATLAGAEAVGEYTVDLITSEPDPLLPNRLRVLRMVSPTAAAEDGYAENPVGTGAYVFESWQRGQSLTLVANDNYWGEPKPTIGIVELRFLPDNNTRVSALNAGEIHIAINLPPALSEGIELLTSAAAIEAGYLVMDTGEFPFNEPDFRRALQYAIDFETINQQLFNGVHSLTNCQPVVPTAGGFNEQLEPYPYDPELAQELLEGLDLPDDFALNFEATAAVYLNDREVSEAIAGYWRAVGLEVDMTLNEIDAYLDIIFNPQDSNAVILGWSDQSLNHAARQLGLFVAADGQVPTRAEGQYSEIDPLVQTAQTSFDETERQAAYDEIWQIYCDELIMGHSLDFNALSGIVPGLEYSPDPGNLEAMDYHRITATSDFAG